MRFSFYLKLAISNIRKNKKNYFPYILSNISVICLFFTLCSLTYNTNLYYSNVGLTTLSMVLNFGVYTMELFALIFLFYTNSFLFKRRKKELGLYNVLGMEKRHLAVMNAFETVVISVFSLICGFVVGILFYKFFELLLFKILNQPIIEGFHLSIKAFRITARLFIIIFLLNFLYNLWQLRSVSAVSLMSGAKHGEKEPKARLLMTLAGIVCLGGGYFLAQTVPASVDAVLTFFPAVILVMLGTYFLFVAGSIVLLKILKKKKKFYYHPRHFTTISQMIYRMKQNAVGLANISILSTMVIVTLSTTTSLYVGMDDMADKMYSREANFNFISSFQENLDLEQVDSLVKTMADDKHVNISNIFMRNYVHDLFERTENNLSLRDFETEAQGETVHVFFIEQKYLPELNLDLQEDELVLYPVHAPLLGDTLNFGQKTYKIVDYLDELDGDGEAQVIMMESYFLIVRDASVIENIYAMNGQNPESISYQSVYAFDIEKSQEQVFCDQVSEKLSELMDSDRLYYQSKSEMADDMYSLYGGLFFIGLFLGAVFIIATVLIIYYKQISEGYDDAERFKIMKKVGMSQQEIKKTIRTQILGVFFLPLIVACVHMIFAFRLIEILLGFLQLQNTGLFMICCLGVVGIFTLFYALVFLITSQEYYKIVH